MGSAFGVISEETPAYEVLQRFENYEIRRYEPRVAVQVAMNHANDSTAFKTLAGYIGVMSSPRNERSEAIAMTAPVVSSTSSSSLIGMKPSTGVADAASSSAAPRTTQNKQQQSTLSEKKVDVGPQDDQHLMQFVLPKIYDMTNHPPPKPTPTWSSPNLSTAIVERPERTFAVHTFSGRWTSFEEQKRELLRWLKEEKEDDSGNMLKIKVKQPLHFEVYRYNPPWTLPMFRTNEVAIEVELT
ncbi:unnamed protein product [Amoebophrya sp. A120]|nr:unnamed protein product [Amoebophrya sp. A120]|eukprot:GSA120T00008740001.1